MKLLVLSLLGLGLAATAAAETTTTVTIAVPASHQLQNPQSLPASTRATLSASGAARSAPLTSAAEFVFANVSAGSYLLDVHCADYFFQPLRLDVTPAAAGGGGSALSVVAWETFRGNDWGNKGEAAPRVRVKGGAGDAFAVRVLGRKEYFMERTGFSVFSILKNPMILLALLSMGIFVGMPYLVENMDPEIRAEFEARQKSNPMNAVLGAAAGGGGPQSGPAGFDMAAFLAGSSSSGGRREEAGSSSAAAAAAPPPAPGGNGGGGGKKNQRRRE